MKDKDEKNIIKSMEHDEWVPVKNIELYKKKFTTAAKNTLLKDQRMNIRISKRDLFSLKSKALEEGLPYQTLVSSILHKYIKGQLVEKK